MSLYSRYIVSCYINYREIIIVVTLPIASQNVERCISLVIFRYLQLMSTELLSKRTRLVVFKELDTVWKHTFG